MHYRDVELKATENKGTRGVLQTPEGVLPYMTIRGCAAVQSMVFVLSVLNRMTV